MFDNQRIKNNMFVLKNIKHSVFGQYILIIFLRVFKK